MDEGELDDGDPVDANEDFNGYVDSHSHFDDFFFKKHFDQAQMTRFSPNNLKGVVNILCYPKWYTDDKDRPRYIANKFKQMFECPQILKHVVGCHPRLPEQYDRDQILKFVDEHEDVICGIGETGLDDTW